LNDFEVNLPIYHVFSDFPDYDGDELTQISGLLARDYGYTYPPEARAKFVEFMDMRKEFPYFSNARTVRNCMERARRVAATRILTDALDNGMQYGTENNIFDMRLYF
jgi:hypothetical protein